MRSVGETGEGEETGGDNTAEGDIGDGDTEGEIITFSFVGLPPLPFPLPDDKLQLI